MIINIKPVKRFLDVELKKIARSTEKQPELEIILVGDDFASEKYVSIKERLATKHGILTHVKKFDTNIPLDYVLEQVRETEFSINGRIIQLPLPQGYEEVIETLNADIDVDCLLEETLQKNTDVLPPTIRAIDLCLQHMLSQSHTLSLTEKVDLSDMTIAVIGKGALVGKPLLHYLPLTGASDIITIDKETVQPADLCKKADIVVSGAGSPKLINKDWLKDTAIVIDAGTSESNGALSGDVDADDIQDSVKLIPSPGGIGPLTVRCLFWNVYSLSQ